MLGQILIRTRTLSATHPILMSEAGIRSDLVDDDEQGLVLAALAAIRLVAAAIADVFLG